jgi:hypothetical protein
LAEAARQDRQPYYEVLKFRAENVHASSAEMAERMTDILAPDRPFTATRIRKMLERARKRFAQLVVNEVSRSLDHPTVDQLEQELVDLELLEYCRPVITSRKRRR